MSAESLHILEAAVHARGNRFAQMFAETLQEFEYAIRKDTGVNDARANVLALFNAANDDATNFMSKLIMKDVL